MRAYMLHVHCRNSSSCFRRVHHAPDPGLYFGKVDAEEQFYQLCRNKK